MKEYSEETGYEEFFRYIKRQWKPDDKKSKIRFVPIFNYFDLINQYDFDKIHLWLTNHISEFINSILKSKFKTKFSTLNEWKKSLLDKCEKHDIDKI